MPEAEKRGSGNNEVTIGRCADYTLPGNAVNELIDK